MNSANSHQVLKLSRVRQTNGPQVGWRVQCTCGYPCGAYRKVIDAYHSFNNHLMAMYHEEEQGADA